MRDIAIIIPKTQYHAGETIEGHVIAKCDDDFEHNGIRLTFKGREHTRIVVSHGKTSSVHTDEHIYFDETVYLEEAGVMSAGERRLPFSFQFPEVSEEMQSSYSGINGWIEYTLEAVVEISWARDVKEKIILDFKKMMERPPQQSQRQYAERDGYQVLDVEIENNVFCLGDQIPLRFRVSQDVKIREVRVELNSNEIAYAGRIKRNTRNRLAELSIDDEEIQRDLWMDVQFNTDDSMPTTFNRPIITNETSLKVTLNIPWSRDESVEIPITIGYCSSQQKKEEYEFIDF